MKLNIAVRVEGTDAVNDWDFWVYPETVDFTSEETTYYSEFIEKYLKEAKKAPNSSAGKSFDDLIKSVVTGKLASEIYHNAKKIYPLKRVEIIKSKVIK